MLNNELVAALLMVLAAGRMPHHNQAGPGFEYGEAKSRAVQTGHVLTPNHRYRVRDAETSHLVVAARNGHS